MAQVKAVPDGFTTVTPLLNLKDAAAAIELYMKAFGADVLSHHMTLDGKIMMAELKIGNAIVRVAEAIKDAPTQCALQLYVDNADAWWARATEAGLSLVVPLQDMFWGDRMGVVRDDFGTSWTIATHIEDVSPDELHRRAAEVALKSK
jgi:PhnB protein